MQHSPGFLALVEQARDRINEVSIEQVDEWLQQNKSLVLIDNREDNEWQKGALPHAIHLGKGIIERDIEQAYPDKDTCLVLYCGGGFRSALVADNLQQMGYTNVYSMAGGVRRWQEIGRALVSTN